MSNQGNPPQEAPGSILGQLMLTRPAVNEDRTLAPWLGQYLTRLAGAIGSSSSNSSTQTINEQVSSLSSSLTLSFGASGADSATQARLNALEAAVERGQLPLMLTAARPLVPLPPPPSNWGASAIVLYDRSVDTTLTANATCLAVVVPSGQAYGFSAGLPGSVFESINGTASASTTLTLLNAGSSVGTVLFPSGSSVGTATVSSNFTVAGGAVLLLKGPPSPDAHLAGVVATLVGFSV